MNDRRRWGQLVLMLGVLLVALPSAIGFLSGGDVDQRLSLTPADELTAAVRSRITHRAYLAELLSFTNPRLAAAVVDWHPFRAHILETDRSAYRLRTSQAKRKEGPPAA